MAVHLNERTQSIHYCTTSNNYTRSSRSLGKCSLSSRQSLTYTNAHPMKSSTHTESSHLSLSLC
jgi:hypothetical protein